VSKSASKQVEKYLECTMSASGRI